MSGCLAAGCILFAAQAAWSVMTGAMSPRVLPPAGQGVPGKAPFRFAVVGDTESNMGVFEEILARIRKDEAALILHLGDIVRRYDERQFDWLLHELDEENLAVPFCAVPGDRDIDAAAQETAARYRLYENAFGPRRYWFSYANALFVAFNRPGQGCDPDDLRWLDSTLQRLRDQYALCFVYMHRPPRQPHSTEDATEEEGVPELVEVLRRHKVSAVFAADMHTYMEDETGDIPLYISGGGGGEMLQPGERYHYLLCTVRTDGSFRIDKRESDVRVDADYAEYVLRVKLPQWAMPLAGAALLLSGIFLAAAPRAHGSRFWNGSRSGKGLP